MQSVAGWPSSYFSESENKNTKLNQTYDNSYEIKQYIIVMTMLQFDIAVK